MEKPAAPINAGLTPHGHTFPYMWGKSVSGWKLNNSAPMLLGLAL